jgi:hypothetical protein
MRSTTMATALTILLLTATTASAEKHWYIRGEVPSPLPTSPLGDSWGLVADTAQGNYLHPGTRAGGYACRIDYSEFPYAWVSETRATEAEAQRDCVRFAATQDRRWKVIEDQLSWTYADVWGVMNSGPVCDCGGAPSAEAMPAAGVVILACGLIAAAAWAGGRSQRPTGQG